MTAYYNEIDPYAAQWLRNLIDAGHIAPGLVDERSIEDVSPADLDGFTQCHFFAGIGVWSLALRMARWPDNRPIWTGSCPCQPFSASGKLLGFDDERHLWPAWQWLIGECRPGIVVGEQVANKAAEPWLDLVQTDLEALGYAFGAVAFPSASVGAPHIRDRTYWVANASRQGFQERVGDGRIQCETMGSPEGQTIVGSRDVGGLADTTYQRIDRRGNSGSSGRPEHSDSGKFSGLAQSNSNGREPWSETAATARYGNTAKPAGRDDRHHQPGPTNGFWQSADWLFCQDGKWRPVEPGTFPLAHGAASRVGRLRAYGNAINAAQAAEFVRCVA